MQPVSEVRAAGRSLASHKLRSFPHSTYRYIGGLPTLAMFSNEPGEGGTPNCLFDFPTVGGRARVGDVRCGYLRTVTSVRRGAALTWCYGPSDVERGYSTACASS